MNPLRRIVALMAIAVTASLPLLAQGNLVQSGLGEGSVVLDPGFRGTRIEVAGRGWTGTELAAEATITRIWKLSDGWLATGTRDSGEGAEMVLLRGRADGGEELMAPPQPVAARLRGGAVPVLADGEWRGIAWLEGGEGTAMSVRATTREDGEWGPTEVVSTPGPGSQVSLSAAVLADDSWLLVWTAFDGEDDEVFWSRRVDGLWSRPSRVHADNDMPDITPRLHATGSGALLAWSWLDGSDYRLKLAVFRGGSWRVLDYLGGKGSLFPTFFAANDGIYLLHRNVDPAGWHVLELDAAGRIWRRAVLPEESRERPVLDAVEASKVRLRWPVRVYDIGGAPSATVPQQAAAPSERTVEVEWRVEP